MQENQAGLQPRKAPAQEQNGAETDFMDPRPLGGLNTPQEHPYSVQSVVTRPVLGAGQSVLKENEEADGAEEQNVDAQPVHDEVDASPEEQFIRHHVELDPTRFIIMYTTIKLKAL